MVSQGSFDVDVKAQPGAVMTPTAVGPPEKGAEAEGEPS